MKLTKHYGQYRITLPREVIKKEGLEKVEYVMLSRFRGVGIVVEEYHGKSKERRDVPEDQT